MPRGTQPWFRFHSAALTSRKLHDLPDRLVKPWLYLLCLANIQEPRGVLPSMEEIAFALRLKPDKALTTIQALVDLGFVDSLGDGYAMHDWDDWQFGSDVRETPGRSAADELRRTRGGATVNAPPLRRATTVTDQTRTDTELETEQNRAPDQPFAFTYAAEYARRHGGRPPPPVEHAAALALEREYGADACLQAAQDLDWQKHPNYMRPILEDRRNGRPTGANNAEAGPTAAESPYAGRPGHAGARIVVDG